MLTHPAIFTKAPRQILAKSRARMVSGPTLGYITFEESESVSDNFSVSKRTRGISRLASRQESGSRLAMVWCQFHGGGSIMSDQFTSEYFSRQAREASEPDQRAQKGASADAGSGSSGEWPSRPLSPSSLSLARWSAGPTWWLTIWRAAFTASTGSWR